MAGSLWFANESNAGKFFDRLPHFFDFAGDLIPRDGWEVWRALFDLPSPYFDGSLKYDYPEGRVYLFGGFYVPEYFYKMLETLNIAILSTLVGFIFGFLFCFLAARNLVKNRLIRWVVRRYMEILRAFPEIVIAGFFAAILSLGPIPAMFAVGIHTIGALGKLFFEVVENADMKADEGSAGCRGKLVRARRFRHCSAGHAELHVLCVAAPGNQCPRLDHYRCCWRWRYRRGVAAVDRPRPSGQDARHRACCCW